MIERSKLGDVFLTNQAKAHSSGKTVCVFRDRDTMYTINKLDLVTAYETYREEWLEIVARQSLNPSLGPDWQMITASSHGSSESCEVMVVTKNSEVVAVIPYLRRQVSYHGIPLTEFSLLSNLVCYHNELVSSLPISDTFSLIVQHEPDCDLFRFASFFDRTVQTPGTVASIANLPGIQVIEEPGDASPYLPIVETWDKIYRRQHKKFRYKIRRRVKRLDEQENLVIRWYEEPSKTEELLAAIRRVERNSWKFNAGVDIAARDQELKYHQLLLPWLADTGHLVAGVLHVDDQPIAYTIACYWQHWTGFSKTSFDSEFAKIEPGAILTEATLRRCVRRGTQEFDFLGSADSYKLSWTKRVRKHSDLTLYNKCTIKGRAILFARRARRWLTSSRDASES